MDNLFTSLIEMLPDSERFRFSNWSEFRKSIWLYPAIFVGIELFMFAFFRIWFLYIRVAYFFSLPSVRRVVSVMTAILTSIGLFVLLGWLVYTSTLLLVAALNAAENREFQQTTSIFFGAFICIFLFTHIVGYCFAGLLNTWPMSGRLWPKGIDYIYYVFGSAVLLILISELYRVDDFQIDILKYEILIGIFLFNLKLFKTSHEVFPEKFQYRGRFVRPLFLRNTNGNS